MAGTTNSVNGEANSEGHLMGSFIVSSLLLQVMRAMRVARLIYKDIELLIYG